jgi:hypothetical protein
VYVYIHPIPEDGVYIVMGYYIAALGVERNIYIIKYDTNFGLDSIYRKKRTE